MDQLFAAPPFWSAMSFVLAAAMFVYHFARDKKTDIHDLLDKKREISDCEAIQKINKASDAGTDINEAAFRHRIGKELDDHEARLSFGERRFNRIEKCLIFLVDKQEPGASSRMGLYE